MFVNVNNKVAAMGRSVNSTNPTIHGATKSSPHRASRRASGLERRRGSGIAVIARSCGGLRFGVPPGRRRGGTRSRLVVEGLLELGLHLVELGVHVEVRRSGELRQVLHEHVERPV